MPCAEIVKAIEWRMKSTETKIFPVVAYFTKHYGTGEPNISSSDAVHYASGDVYAYDIDKPKPYLAGTLKYASRSTGAGGEMVSAPGLTYEVKIFPDGTLIYEMKLNGQPGSVNTVQGTCVKDLLLTAPNPNLSEVVTVGVARKPAYELSPP